MEGEYSHIDGLLAGYIPGRAGRRSKRLELASPEDVCYLLSMREIWFSSLAADALRYTA
ncbi:MAG: hypothetical protein LBT42_06870 [Tannerella sp.]|jgi:hypothetical protein|nr:hypothetical protein [Tannerella sp.]